MNSFKQLLSNLLHQRIDQQIRSLEINISDVASARNSETKSSVGDKYETGRAAMQRELEQLQAQLFRTQQSKAVLNSFDPGKSHTTVKPGSLVVTTNGRYFISIGIGKIKLGEQVVYCISPASPIGKALMQHTTGQQISFQNRMIKITEIC